jgi:hypothetical protein
MPSWMAWVQIPSGQIKGVGKHKHFQGRECFMKVNIANQSKSSQIKVQNLSFLGCHWIITDNHVGHVHYVPGVNVIKLFLLRY